jgi:hypothetical protein
MVGIDWYQRSTLDLSFAKVRTLLNRNPWPDQNRLVLQGFLFDELDAIAPLDSETQIQWIQRQSQEDFYPQPYEQMAVVFRNMGLQEEAIKVLIEKNKKAGYSLHKRDREEVLAAWKVGCDFWKHQKWEIALSYWWMSAQTFLRVIWEDCWYNWIGPSIGFGYRPWRALFASAFMILVGYVVFRAGKSFQIMTPNNKDAYKRGLRLTQLYPTFNAFAYSLETFVPILKLGISDYWKPNTNCGWQLKPVNMLLRPFLLFCLRLRYGRGANLQLNRVAPLRVGGLLRLYLWFHIVLGWILTTLWVGGFTGLIKS